MKKLSALLLVVVSMCVVFSPGLSGQAKPLKILLTNDDGFDSAGLNVMRQALMAAGHRVTVVAPATNMSSTGMSMTSGTIRIEEKSPGVWAVSGTPADAAMIGLAHVLKDTPQDLVVSGTNAGQNLGNSTNSSGTVSAAIAASRYGVPAIATSAGVGEAAAAYAVAASLVNQIISILEPGRAAGSALLPDRLVLNINVPALPADRLKGLKWAPLSKGSSYLRAYSSTAAPNEVRSRLTIDTAASTETDTDLALFRQGYVTLTLLDGDMGVAAPALESVQSKLSKLTLQ